MPLKGILNEISITGGHATSLGENFIASDKPFRIIGRILNARRHTRIRRAGEQITDKEIDNCHPPYSSVNQQ